MVTMRVPAMLTILTAIAMTAVPARAVVALPPPPRGRPSPPAGWAYQWVPPAYQTITDRQWVPERRDVVQDWVDIGGGRLAQVWREVVVPGHWGLTTRRVQVSGGFWQLVQIVPPPYLPPIPLPRPVIISPGTVGVNGYQDVSGGEDLSKFSPLSEWPAK